LHDALPILRRAAVRAAAAVPVAAWRMGPPCEAVRLPVPAERRPVRSARTADGTDWPADDAAPRVRPAVRPARAPPSAPLPRSPVRRDREPVDRPGLNSADVRCEPLRPPSSPPDPALLPPVRDADPSHDEPERSRPPPLRYRT